ncbi:MAG: OmpH family outer membrane protein [Verrucomicrobiota bacterium JB023]|nr:OmpH family outer membrane protein [Verrucomicrobiota bacterium JB023]
MKTGIILAGVMFAMGLVAQAQETFKVATVDMKRLLKDYYRTEAAQQQLNEKQALLAQENNSKQQELQKLEEEIDALRKNMNDPSINDAKKKEFFDEFQNKQQEGVAMARSLKEFLDRKRRSLQDEMQRQMKGILEEIRIVIDETAKAGDYDFVFDKSGNSTTQVPVLLYSKDSFDMTEDVLGELNKDKPADSE